MKQQTKDATPSPSKSENVSTLFSIENGSATWYVDYDNEDGGYQIYKDERYRRSFNSLGDSLEYIFITLGSTRLKVVKQ